MSVASTIKKQDFFMELCKKCENGTLSAANLFFCEDEVTSRIALILAALKLEYPNTFELMDERGGDFARISSGVDLDVKIFPKGDKLLVDDSASIVAEASVKPVNLPYKIFIINNVDVSMEAAQNKLLKIIEEPPKNVRFLISAKNEQRVLPTIKSRCDKVKIPPLCMEEISKFCTQKLAAILGGGYIGRTQELENLETLSDIASFGVKIACEMKNSKQVLTFSKQFLQFADNFKLVLQVLEIALEDILKIKCESENLCKLTPYIGQLKEVEPEYSVVAICEICKLISHFVEKVEFNANFPLAVDNFLLNLLEVKYLCK